MPSSIYSTVIYMNVESEKTLAVESTAYELVALPWRI